MQVVYRNIVASIQFSPVPPDIVDRPSLQIRRILPSKKVDQILRALPPATKNVRMLLKEVYIISNRDIGRGDIYLATLVTDDFSSKPPVTIRGSYQNIPDGAPLDIEDLVIYRNEPGKFPRFIDYRILVMESDQELRDVGQLMNEVTQSEEYKNLVNALLSAARTGYPPALIMAGATLVMNLIQRVLMNSKDDQLINIEGSHDNAFDDLGTIRGPITRANEYARVVHQVQAAP